MKCRAKREYWRRAFLSLVCLACLQMVSHLSLSQSRRVMDQREAMKTFAGLLKIPLAPPEVTVKLTQAPVKRACLLKTSAGIHWTTNSRPRLLFVRERLIGKLPAIICLHGTGGSRESMTARDLWDRSLETIRGRQAPPAFVGLGKGVVAARVSDTLTHSKGSWTAGLPTPTISPRTCWCTGVH